MFIFDKGNNSCRRKGRYNCSKNAVEPSNSYRGFGYNKEFVENLKVIAEKRGIIILTDPDHAGERIRRFGQTYYKKCKHAFLPPGKGL